MAPTTATFTYTAGPEEEVLEKVDWFGRYNRMTLAERTAHSMVICTGSLLWYTTFLRVVTRTRGNAVEVTVQAWASTLIRGDWDASPVGFLIGPPRASAWDYAVALVRYLGVEQPEKLFVYPWE